MLEPRNTLEFMNKSDIEYSLKYLKLEYVKELKFLDNRKFRFDFAIPKYKIAIEYDGIMSSKARHTTITGYSKDTEKYNLATVNGWRILRYTVLTPNNLIEDLKTMTNII